MSIRHKRSENTMLPLTDAVRRDSSLTPSTLSVRTKADPSTIRTTNKMLIFGLLYPNKAMSRAEISRDAGLARMSVTDVVSEMMNDGLLVETGSVPLAGRGKRPTLLTINANALNIVSIDLSQPYLIQGGVTDLTGKMIHRAEQPVPDDIPLDPQGVVDLCMQLIPHATAPILGVGVACPGIIASDGVVVESANLGWTNVDLKTRMEQDFHLPVQIDNDANSALLAQRYLGGGSKDEIFVHIGRGLGAAVLIDDCLVNGTHHAAGEIGHVGLYPNQPECSCGNHGCLDRMLSVPTVRESIRNIPDAKERILSAAGEFLGYALALSASLLDVAQITVYGPPDFVNNTFIDAIRNTIESMVVPAYRQHMNITRCQLGDDVAILGESISVITRRIPDFHQRSAFGQ